MKKATLAAVAMLVAAMSNSSQGAMRITEWMYSGNGPEYVEFTNTGVSAIDLTGWSYDDDSATPGVFSLSGFGSVAAGESVVITEGTAAAFIADWSLAPTVKVLGGYTNNLGRNDAINLFDASNTLVDVLAYGDQTFAGSIRTQEISGNPITLAALGANDIYQWQLSTPGDAYGSYFSLGGDLGNPGIGNYVVPEPSTIVMLILGSVALCASGAKRLRRLS